MIINMFKKMEVTDKIEENMENLNRELESIK